MNKEKCCIMMGFLQITIVPHLCARVLLSERLKAKRVCLSLSTKGLFLTNYVKVYGIPIPYTVYPKHKSQSIFSKLWILRSSSVLNNFVYERKCIILHLGQ